MPNPPNVRPRTPKGRLGTGAASTRRGTEAGAGTAVEVDRLSRLVRKNLIPGLGGAVASTTKFEDGGSDTFPFQATFDTAWPQAGDWNVHAYAYITTGAVVAPVGGSFVTFTVTLGIPSVGGITSRTYPLGLPEGIWNISGLILPVDCFDVAEDGALARYVGLTVSATGSGATATGGADLYLSGRCRP